MAEDQRAAGLIERSAKRVRAFLGGEAVFDTIAPTLVWEIDAYPAYYIPEADVRTELLTPSDTTKDRPGLGTARYFHVKGGDRTVDDAAWQYTASPVEELRTLLRFR